MKTYEDKVVPQYTFVLFHCLTSYLDLKMFYLKRFYTIKFIGTMRQLKFRKILNDKKKKKKMWEL